MKYLKKLDLLNPGTHLWEENQVAKTPYGYFYAFDSTELYTVSSNIFKIKAVCRHVNR